MSSQNDNENSTHPGFWNLWIYLIGFAWVVVAVFAFFAPAFHAWPVISLLVTLASVSIFWGQLLKEAVDRAEDYSSRRRKGRLHLLRSNVILVIAAAVSLIGAYSSQEAPVNRTKASSAPTAFADLYGKPKIDWGLQDFNKWGVLYTGELVELIRVILAIAIAQRVLLGPFLRDLRPYARLWGFGVSPLRFKRLGRLGRCWLVRGPCRRVRRAWQRSIWVFLCQVMKLSTPATLIVLIPLWVIGYSWYDVNAPAELYRSAVRNVQSRFVLANAIFDPNEKSFAKKVIQDDIVAWFGETVAPPANLDDVVWRLKPDGNLPDHPLSVLDRNFSVPYRWYSGFSLVMFLGCGVPFFLTPLLCLPHDLWSLETDRQKFEEDSKDVLKTYILPQLSEKLAVPLSEFKKSVRFQAERYIEFPIWFVVFGAFELSVGRQTLAEDASKLTILLVLIFLLFGMVVVHVGLVYERTFSWLRGQCDEDAEWLAAHSPTKFFSEFRETSILGLASWFAGATIVFGILSQAVQFVGS